MREISQCVGGPGGTRRQRELPNDTNTTNPNHKAVNNIVSFAEDMFLHIEDPIDSTKKLTINQSSVKLKGTALIYKNYLCFYAIITSYMKDKLRKSIKIYKVKKIPAISIKNNKIFMNKFYQESEKSTHLKP